MEIIRTVVTWIFSIVLAAGVLALTENFKEFLKRWGGNTRLVRIIDKIVPAKWQEALSWKYLRVLWWLWLIIGLSSGFASAVRLTDFLTPSHSQYPSGDALNYPQVVVFG